MAYRFSPQHYRAKATIKACVEAGAGIEYMPDAPRFRYTPPAVRAIENAPPSTRRLNFPRKPHMKGCKNWNPPALSWGPSDYRIPMAGDDHRLERARRAWAGGDPTLLRSYLAERRAA